MKAYMTSSNDTITLKCKDHLDLGVTRFVWCAYICCYDNMHVILGWFVGGCRSGLSCFHLIRKTRGSVFFTLTQLHVKNRLNVQPFYWLQPLYFGSPFCFMPREEKGLNWRSHLINLWACWNHASFCAHSYMFIFAAKYDGTTYYDSRA